MIYCTADILTDFVLAQYLAKVEELNPGSVDRHIGQVSEEIDEALLVGGYSIPTENNSATLTRMCAVMAAWRCIGEITSLMDTEAASDNEWLPLQKLNTRAEKELDKIRDGKLNPVPDNSTDDCGIEVSAPEPIFTREKWETF